MVPRVGPRFELTSFGDWGPVLRTPAGTHPGRVYGILALDPCGLVASPLNGTVISIGGLLHPFLPSC